MDAQKAIRATAGPTILLRHAYAIVPQMAAGELLALKPKAFAFRKYINPRDRRRKMKHIFIFLQTIIFFLHHLTLQHRLLILDTFQFVLVQFLRPSHGILPLL